MDILDEISALVLDYVEPEELFNELLRRGGMDVWMALEDGENLSVRIMVDDSGDYRHLSVPFAELVEDRVSALDCCLPDYFQGWSGEVLAASVWRGMTFREALESAINFPFGNSGTQKQCI